MGLIKGTTVASQFAGPADPPSVKFEGPQAMFGMLRAIGPMARLILTLGGAMIRKVIKNKTAALKHLRTSNL